MHDAGTVRGGSYSPTGEPVGEILLPPGEPLSAADDEHVWYIERDELDVGSFVRYRLTPAEPN